MIANRSQGMARRRMKKILAATIRLMVTSGKTLTVTTAAMTKSKPLLMVLCSTRSESSLEWGRYWRVSQCWKTVTKAIRVGKWCLTLVTTQYHWSSMPETSSRRRMALTGCSTEWLTNASSISSLVSKVWLNRSLTVTTGQSSPMARQVLAKHLQWKVTSTFKMQKGSLSHRLSKLCLITRSASCSVVRDS